MELRDLASTRGRFALFERGPFDLESSRVFKMTRWISWSKCQIQRILPLLCLAVAISYREIAVSPNIHFPSCSQSIRDRRVDRPAKITPFDEENIC